MNLLWQDKWQRFKKDKRAWLALGVLSVSFFLSLFSELIANNRPIILHYSGSYYFPVFKHYSAKEFGETVRTTVDFRALRKSPQFTADSTNWMLLPLIPFDPNENMDNLATSPPSPPTSQNWLGTDDRGRDLLTRLIYGFRNSMLFALVSWLFITVIALAFGAMQGYFGGRFDFLGQRFTEIWHSLPLLYVVIFLISIFPPSLWLLTLVWVLFNWIPLANYVRAEVLRVRKAEYITASQALGAGTTRILIKHVLPNSLTPVLTFSPFIIAASIGSLAALDYLGLGLPAPTSSWGELLRQGKENLHCWWLAIFPAASLFLTLLMLNLIGDGVRTAFDTRRGK
jgi:microcin C transport system permease protein